MRTITTGIVVFILWSALCTWYYLRYIKGAEPANPAPVEQQSAESPPPLERPGTVPETAEVILESPGGFTVYHEFDRSEVIPDGDFNGYIERTIEYWEQVPGARINVTGHTDNIGSEDYNQKLGMRRAQSTKEYLTGKGVPGDIIRIDSRGEDDPVASNQTDSGRAQNRRTEIKITE